MQVQHPGGHAVPQRQRVSQVLAGERVEQPTYSIAVTRQGNLDGLVWGGARSHLLEVVAGIGLPGDALEAVLAQ